MTEADTPANDSGGLRRHRPVPRELADRIPPRRWSSFLFYEATYWTSLIATILGFSLRISGTRNVPKTGPVLFIANHQSFLDPVLVGLAVRRHISYLARKTLFQHPAFAWLIRMLNAVPIDQEGLGIEGLRTILALLQAGRAVIVYPEGERTADGAIHALQPGIQLLIKKTRAPIVPVGIAGAFEAWPRSRKLPRLAPLFLPPSRRAIAVVVGKPIDAEHYADLPRQQVLTEMHAELQRVHDEAEALRRKR
jgi:1-acyl-sn-glycerol-3-phosphate acyltransferase